MTPVRGVAGSRHRTDTPDEGRRDRLSQPRGRTAIEEREPMRARLGSCRDAVYARATEYDSTAEGEAAKGESVPGAVCPALSRPLIHPSAVVIARRRLYGSDIDQRYVIERDVQHRYVANREAARFLPFVLPHMRAGVNVLDVGSGVGAIALDLAPMVTPGRIVGIDADAGQVEVAKASARKRGLENADFVAGSVYELPFDGGTFDVVYANAVLMYVRDQVRALAEMRRVLAPGGLAAVIDDDLGTVVMSPERPEVEIAPRLFERAIAHEGGNARYSRHLRTLMLEAGFTRTRGVAHAPEVYGDLEETRWFADFVVGLFSAPTMRDVIVGEGWCTPVELRSLIEGVREWGEQEDAFAAWLYCGALGWAEEASGPSLGDGP